MVSVNTLCKKLLNVKSTVVEDAEFYSDQDGVHHIRIKARIWRGLDWGGTLVEVAYHTHRIEYPVHGVLVADVPWAYPGSGFTKDFDLTVGWLAACLPRSVVSEYMRIDWETVGICVHRTLNDIEPERSMSLNGQ